MGSQQARPIQKMGLHSVAEPSDRPDEGIEAVGQTPDGLVDDGRDEAGDAVRERHGDLGGWDELANS